MSLTSIAIVAGLAILTLWGVVAPRGQWRVLTAWNHRTAWDGGPSSLSVGIHRTVAVIATVALLFTGWSLLQSYQATVRASERSISAVHTLWGFPTPMIVDRIVENESSVPPGLVQQPISRYQPVDSVHRTPAYIFELPDWNRLSQADDGFIGTQPPVGIAALDSASIVVQLHGDSRCVPREAVVVENEKTIAIAVYYGRPTPKGASKKSVSIDSCKTALPGKDTTDVLLPLSLSAPVGKRHVTNLDGSPIALATESPATTPTPAP